MVVTRGDVNLTYLTMYDWRCGTGIFILVQSKQQNKEYKEQKLYNSETSMSEEIKQDDFN